MPADDAEAAALLAGSEQSFSWKCLDDFSGQFLKDSVVEEAWAMELPYFHSTGVCHTVPKSPARVQPGRPFATVR